MKAATKKAQSTNKNAEPALDPAVFAGLKKVLAKRARELQVKTDTHSNYFLETKSASYHRGGHTMFGCAMVRKGYVSFHLFGLYMRPELLEKMSPELRKRMVGKTCFKFKREEPELFSELAGFVDDSYRVFEKMKLL